MDTDDTNPKRIPPPPTGSLGIGGGGMDFDQTVRVNVPAKGTKVFGRYELERILGRGGMGIVWLAHDLKLERQVALKFLPNLIGLDPGAIKELKTETRRGLELSHPNVVRIYDFVDDDDAAAISMEYVDGRTLSELRSETDLGVFSVEEISKWLVGVCDALDYAHQQCKIVHRDMKPANIMVTNGDQVAKVADFGIARSLSDTMSRLSVSAAGTSGTLPYMSPQQAMGDRPGPTDDVYSLGATVYELLAGKPPFYSGDIITQINNKIPPTMQARRDELDIKGAGVIPKEWEIAIAASLSKEAITRPQSAGELAVMLGLKSADSVVLSKGATAALKSSKAEEKSKVPLLIGAGVVAVAVIGGFMLLSGGQDPQSKEVETVVVSRPKSDEKADTAAALEADEASVTNPEPLKSTPASTTASGATVSAAETAAPVGASDTASDAPAKGDGVVAMAGSPSGGATAATEEPKESETSAPAAPFEASPTVSGGLSMANSDDANPRVGAVGDPTVAATPTPISAATSGQMSLTPEGGVPQGTTIVIPGQPGVNGGQPSTIVLPPGTVLPPGSMIVQPGGTLPQGAVAAVEPEMPPQPVVGDPPEGHWKIEQLFPTPPFAMFSENGKRHLLYQAQDKLKEKGLYSSTIDGKEGKNTHNAIILFQAKNSLIPNGLLDVPTLAALEMRSEEDKKDWSPPARSYSGSGYRRPSPTTREEPNFLQRTGNKLKGLFD